MLFYFVIHSTTPTTTYDSSFLIRYTILHFLFPHQTVLVLNVLFGHTGGPGKDYNFGHYR